MNYHHVIIDMKEYILELEEKIILMHKEILELRLDLDKKNNEEIYLRKLLESTYSQLNDIRSEFDMYKKDVEKSKNYWRAEIEQLEDDNYWLTMLVNTVLVSSRDSLE